MIFKTTIVVCQIKKLLYSECIFLMLRQQHTIRQVQISRQETLQINIKHAHSTQAHQAHAPKCAGTHSTAITPSISTCTRKIGHLTMATQLPPKTDNRVIIHQYATRGITPEWVSMRPLGFKSSTQTFLNFLGHSKQTQDLIGSTFN